MPKYKLPPQLYELVFFNLSKQETNIVFTIRLGFAVDKFIF